MKFENHTGLFLDSGTNGTKKLFALKPYGPDIFGRPQIALNSQFMASWEGHAPWDRFSAVIFDVFGFLEPVDGLLDLGQTYDGEELRFSRVEIDLGDFEFTMEACMDRYLSHLESAGRLCLVDSNSEEVKGLAAALPSLVTELGFVSRVS